MFKLSNNQKKAFEFLTEFYSPQRNRACGRSYVIACVIVRTSIENQGVPIRIIDHYDITANQSRKVYNDRRMMELVEKLVIELPSPICNGFHFSRHKMTITYIPELNREVIHRSDVINDLDNHTGL
jgi:hypothetical protein